MNDETDLKGQLNAISTTLCSSSSFYFFAGYYAKRSEYNSVLYLYEILHAEHSLRQNTYRAGEAVCPDPSQ